jgi:hypothetical protein
MRQWRQAVWHILTAAAASADNETWYDWVLGLRSRFTTAAAMVGTQLDEHKVIQLLSAKKTMRVPRQSAPPPPLARWPDSTVLSTVHGVKGKEFEVVALHYRLAPRRCRAVVSCIAFG